MTKSELQIDRDEWKQQAESLQDELDSLNEAYYELECKLAYYEDHLLFNGIIDLDNFIFRAKVDGVWNEKLQQFIDYYIKYHNKKE